MANRLTKLTAAMMLLCGVTGAQAQLNLDNPYNVYQTYGNTNVYSMPYNALIYDSINGGGVGPGNPYYINSTPGAIQDLVVIYTGSGGQGVTTNAAGFEDAYGAPNGQQTPYADTAGAGVSSVPGVKPGIANTLPNTWDASLLSLKSFLGANGDAVFLFNNNDTNSDQNLAIWAKVWITTNTNGVYQDRYLYLSNMGQVYGFQPPPNALGPDPTIDYGNIANPLINADPNSLDFNKTDYVESGGNVCFNAALQPVGCNDPTKAYTINHNLGANQVAYAGRIPVLDGYFDTLFANTSDADLANFTLHIDLRLGCKQQTRTDPYGWVDCTDRQIDNGYEQLFLASTNSTLIHVPEPGTLLLLGLGMFGLAAARRRNQG